MKLDNIIWPNNIKYLELSISNVTINFINSIPNTIEKLVLSSLKINDLTYFKLPKSLTELSLINIPNILNYTTLPTGLFSFSLNGLEINVNKDFKLPDLSTLTICSSTFLNDLFYYSFPKSLIRLDITGCDTVTYLTELKDYSHLESLSCKDCRITVLPKLPKSITDLDISYNRIGTIHSLPPNLKVLICIACGLTELPTLPKNLEILDCNSNTFQSLPNLPKSLIKLNCDKCKYLTMLKHCPPNLIELSCQQSGLELLPDLNTSLETLICSYNNLIFLPKLPDSITELNCSYNNIFAITILPPKLKELECNGCSLKQLPELPPTLIKLSCCKNLLDYLPKLPDNLESLICYQNKRLMALPPLNDSLMRLICDSCNLASLPDLSPTLSTLECNSNQLKSLPFLPNNLLILKCGSNFLTALPPLPASLSVLSIEENPINSINCLPENLSDFVYSNRLYLSILKSKYLPSTLNRIADFNLQKGIYFETEDIYYINKCVKYLEIVNSTEFTKLDEILAFIELDMTKNRKFISLVENMGLHYDFYVALKSLNNDNAVVNVAIKSIVESFYNGLDP